MLYNCRLLLCCCSTECQNHMLLQLSKEAYSIIISYQSIFGSNKRTDYLQYNMKNLHTMDNKLDTKDYVQSTKYLVFTK